MAALWSRLSVRPHRSQLNTRSLSVNSARIAPQAAQALLDGENLSATSSLPPRPAAFVLQHPPELRPVAVGDGPREFAVADQVTHRQVLAPSWLKPKRAGQRHARNTSESQRLNGPESRAKENQRPYVSGGLSSLSSDTGLGPYTVAAASFARAPVAPSAWRTTLRALVVAASAKTSYADITSDIGKW